MTPRKELTVDTYFKVLASNGIPCHGGRGKWPLPNGDEPGEWVEVKGQLVACQRGLHVCRPADLPRWLGPEIYVVEIDSDEMILQEDKVVVRRARLLRKTPWSRALAVTFAADCAERVLPIFEKRFPNDDRPRKAIAAARAAAYAAHADAAYAAAAAYDAARAAERQWQGARLMELIGC